MKIGDIYQVGFPYEEDKNKFKERPAVIIIVERKEKEFTALKITSKARPNSKFDVPIDDWKSTGLNRMSYVRCDKRESFTENDIVMSVGKNGYIGTLSLSVQQDIAQAMYEYSMEYSRLTNSFKSEVDNKLNEKSENKKYQYKAISESAYEKLVKSNIPIEIKKQSDKIIIKYNKADEDAVMAAITPPTNSLKR